MKNFQATIIGVIAILLWSLLAALTTATAPTPPLLINSICFTIAGIIGLFWMFIKNNFKKLINIHWSVYFFGSMGLFGFHILYFFALRLAPVAEASLIVYLWPLLILLFSSFLLGESLKTGHVLGALLSFIGTTIIIMDKPLSFESKHIVGFILAALCALTWSSYSVLSRRFGNIPTEAVTIYCLFTAIISWILHFSIEKTILPQSGFAWIALLMLGAGPIGIAFYLWDIGIKHGDIKLLGTISYAAPLLSTFILVLTDQTNLSISLIFASFLISIGAIIAARSSTLRLL